MKKLQTVTLVSLTTAALLFSGVASAQDVPPGSPAGAFGDEGQLTISSDTGLSISNTSISGADGSTTAVLLRPAVDYFVVDHFSLGGFVGVDYISTGDVSTTAFSVGPRVGYDIPISARLSVWPKLGLAFASTTTDVDEEPAFPGAEVEDGESNTSVQFNAYVPFMFHPVDHFFLGFGPAVDLDLSGETKATTIAARLTLGGWL